MKIYPDPELPDVEVGWSEQDCREGTRDVRVTLTGIDNEASTTITTVACADLKVTFADLPRERFRVDGALLDLAGNPLITSEGGEVDLRNGFNQDTGLYFDGFANFRVAWTFASGSCESLGAFTVGMGLFIDGEEVPNIYQAPCEFPDFSAQIAPGTYTAQLAAFTQSDEAVALTPVTAPFSVTENGFTNIGTLVFTPCGAGGCP